MLGVARQTRPILAALLALGALACGDDAPGDAPGDSGADAAIAAPPPPADAGAAATAPYEEPFTEHELEEGQTLWDISRTYGVSVQDILDANGMTERDARRLQIGIKIKIPGAYEPLEVETAAERAKARAELPPPEDGAYHFLAPGETVWELARLYDLEVEKIMERNRFTDDDVRSFKVGQAIVIPGITPAKAKSTVKQVERRGVHHNLTEGETVWDLAKNYEVSVSEIMAANGLTEQDVIKLQEGQRLFIPGVARDIETGSIKRKTRPAQRRAGRLARKLGLGTRRAAGMLLRGNVKSEWLRAAGGKKKKLPGFLRWPVKNGWFVRGWGSGDSGYHLAVDIAGKIGWNVRAAAPGIVGYSGSGVKGYGNIVMVIHPGGWVTIYAHNSVNFVKAGQKVKRGAILAELGSTGVSRGPHVHFEFLYKGAMCDPNVLFKPGIRHRSGKISKLKYTTWTRPKDRPKRVQCKARRSHPSGKSVEQESSEPDSAPP
jgi:murein DD-endopeptidase MepM/ murein hydrolase activator NlpD